MRNQNLFVFQKTWCENEIVRDSKELQYFVDKQAEKLKSREMKEG